MALCVNKHGDINYYKDVDVNYDTAEMRSILPLTTVSEKFLTSSDLTNCQSVTCGKEPLNKKCSIYQI